MPLQAKKTETRTLDHPAAEEAAAALPLARPEFSPIWPPTELPYSRTAQAELFQGEAWLQVDLDRLAANLQAVRTFVHQHNPRARIMAVVKANAYGHGATVVAHAFEEMGVDALAVSTVTEGVELRRAGIVAPVLVFNPPLPEEAPAMVAYGLTASISNLRQAQAIAAVARELRVHARVHMEVDTGLHRFGVEPQGAVVLAQQIIDAGLGLEGVYTHLSTPQSPRIRRQELDRFRRVLDALQHAGVDVPLRHAASSAVLVREPAAIFDMVRVGSLLFGSNPAGVGPQVEAVAELQSRVIALQSVAAGEGIGYGRDYVARRLTLAATVPVGYAHGFGMQTVAEASRAKAVFGNLARWVLHHLGLNGLAERRLAGYGHYAVVRGRRLPVIGRVFMQQLVLDATSLPEVEVGDLVKLPVARVNANPRLARVYVRDGKVAHVSSLIGELD